MNNQQPNTITDIITPELPNLMAILSLNNDKDQQHLQIIAMQELNYLEQHAATKPILLKCERSSIILAVKNVMRKNLSLDPSAGLVYVKTRNVNIGTQDNQKWVTVLETQETANGLLSYNRQLGRILDYTNPEVIEDASGKTIGVIMEVLKPSYGQPRWEKYKFGEGDFQRWRKASHNENKRSYKANSGKPQPNDETLNYANPNYTSWKGGLDPEFARAKCIRHSLKKLGANPNEGLIIQQQNLNAKVTTINTEAAFAEASDIEDYAPHEEVNSEINNNQNKSTQQDFNSTDL